MITVTVHDDLIILRGRGEDAEKLSSFSNGSYPSLKINDQGVQTNLKGGYRERVYHLSPEKPCFCRKEVDGKTAEQFVEDKIVSNLTKERDELAQEVKALNAIIDSLKKEREILSQSGKLHKKISIKEVKDTESN